MVHIRNLYMFYVWIKHWCYRTKITVQFKSTEEPRGQECYVINRWNVVSSSTFSIRLITNTECYKRIACIQSLIVVYEDEFDKSETADLDHVLY